MNLKAITLENFKGIREPVRIEISPITLLFGPNNAGKSTLLHALIYARELFESGNADPHFTELGGETIDLGGFDSLVFGNDRSRQIRLRFEFNVSAGELMGRHPRKSDDTQHASEPSEWTNEEIDQFFGKNSAHEGPTRKGISKSDLLKITREHEEEKENATNDLKDNIWYDWHSSVDLCPESLQVASERIIEIGDTKWLEITIGWSTLHQRPLLFSCATGVTCRDDPTIELGFDEESKCLEVKKIDLGTFVLGKIDTPESRERRADMVEKYNESRDHDDVAGFKYFEHLSKYSDVDDNGCCKEWFAEYNSLDDYAISTDQLLRELYKPQLLLEDGVESFPVSSDFSGLPDLTRDISLAVMCKGVEFGWTKTTSGDVLGFSEHYAFDKDREWKRPWHVASLFLDPVINAFLPGFVRCCRQFFVNTRYLSAIRVSPPRDFQPVLPLDARRWANGLAAWDLLFEKEHVLPERLNEWLSRNSEGFSSGFEVRVQHTKQVDVRQSPVSDLLSQPENVTLDQVRQHLLELPEHRLLRVLNLATGALGHPRDIGYGLSQLLPVVVAALDSCAGIVALEEPESNIHPAFQVVLADLFIRQAKANPDALFLIETHSEHLMLRCLRRIRETNEGEIPEGAPSLKPEEIAVHFVEPSEASPRFHRIRIDEGGEFLDPWPRGFFSERMEEIYGDDL